MKHLSVCDAFAILENALSQLLRYTATLLRFAFEFCTRLLDTVHNKALSIPRASLPSAILCLRCHLQASRLRWHDDAESACLSSRNYLGIPGEIPYPGKNYSRSRSLARACRCKSIRWFDDLGTRSNNGMESSPKVLWHRQNFRRDKAVPPRVSRCIHVAAPTAVALSLFAEVVIKYRGALARGKIGVVVPLKIIAPPCCRDRLHSGFNLVRPLHSTYRRAYLPKNIAHRDMNKDETPSTNGIKLIWITLVVWLRFFQYRLFL